MATIFIVGGLVLLLLGGELLVRSAVGLALKLRISPLVVGLTIVSSATSAPELIVSLQAAIDGHADIALGNVIGSNIANIGLILGFVSVVWVLPAEWRAYRFDWWVMIGATLLLGVFIFPDHLLNTWEAAILIALLIGYNYFKIRQSRGQKTEVDVEAAEGKSTIVLLVMLAGAITLLKYGAQFLVDGAVDVAMGMGISERIVSLTVVAFGTSIPELVASGMSAAKGEKDLAIGNVVGSNIFNICSVLGVSGVIQEIPVLSEGTLNYDYWWMLFIALSIFPLMRWFKKGHIGRVEGVILMASYVIYIYFLL